MFIGGVKTTLIICITIIVSCVLFISYNEYTNRYSLITTSDNKVYIFDKKTTIMNKCGEKGCEVVETKLPAKINSVVPLATELSKMFGSDKPMTDEIVKAEAVQDNKQKANPDDNPEKKLEPKEEKGAKEKAGISEKTEEKKDKDSGNKKTEDDSDDEFVE